MAGDSRPPYTAIAGSASGKEFGALSRGGRPRKTPEMREAEELACQRSPDAMRRLVEIATASADEHAAIKAANAVLDRAFGKPTQAITGGDGEPLLSPIDWSRLTDDQLRALVTIGRAATSGTGDDPGGGGGTPAT